MVFAAWLFNSHPVELSIQSLANLAFSGNASFVAALQSYPHVWPPLYPSVLWGLHRLGISAHTANLALFYLTLLWLGLFARRYIRGVHWIYPVALYVVMHPNYVNLQQVVSEALLVPLAAIALSVSLRYCQVATTRGLMTVSLVSSVSCLTRYMALFWIFPVLGGTIWLKSEPGQRIRLLATFSAISLVPVGLVAARSYAATGYLSGMDRIGKRLLVGPAAAWTEMGAFDHLEVAVRAFMTDIFSASQHASHAALTMHSFTGLSLLDKAILGIAAGLLLLPAGRVVMLLRAEGTPPWKRRKIMDPLSVLSALFGVGYLVLLLAIWSVTNNDPVYTRFLYPSYLFLMLWGFVTYSWVQEKDGSLAARMPFQALYLLMLLVHLRRDFSWAGL